MNPAPQLPGDARRRKEHSDRTRALPRARIERMLSRRDIPLLSQTQRPLGCGSSWTAGHTWVGEGTPPPRAARIELASQQPPAIARDQYGIALGRVRTPPVDVPVATLSGQGPPGAAGPGWLVGSTTPLDDATLLRLHGDKSGYLTAYTRSLDAAIRDGFLLPADRAELLAQATAFPFPAPRGG